MPIGLSPEQRRVYLLLLLTVGLYFCGLSFLLLMPKLFRDLGVSETELGWLIGTPLVSFVLLAPYAGYLCDRFSPKRLTLAGIGLATVSGYLLAYVQEVDAYVYVLRLLHGAGHAFTFTPIFSMVAKLMGAEQKAKGIAYFTVIVQLGNVLGSLLGALLVARVSFEAFFVISSALMATAFLVMLWVREPRAEAQSAATAIAPAGLGAYWRLVGARDLWSGMLFILLLGGAFGAVLQFVPTYLDVLYEQGRTPQPIGSYWYLTTTLLAVALVRVLLSNRVYRPGNEQILTLCMLILPVSVLLLCNVDGVIALVTAAILFGMSYGLLFPAMNASVLVRAGSAQGTISGFLAMLYEIGFRGSGFLLGPIADISYAGMFATVAGVLLLGVAGFFALERERGRWWLGSRA